MKFFETIASKLDNFDLKMVMKKKDGKISVMLIPVMHADKKTEDKFPAMTFTGTPEELDSLFLKNITEPLEFVGGMIDNIEQFKKDATEHVKEVAEDSVKKDKKDKKKEKSDKKEAEKTEKPEPADKPKSIEEQFTDKIVEASKLVEEKLWDEAIKIYQEALKLAKTEKQKNMVNEQVMNAKVKKKSAEIEAEDEKIPAPGIEQHMPINKQEDTVLDEPETADEEDSEELPFDL
jgi:PRTRC genetic system protein E